jgi:hypothetical protein
VAQVDLALRCLLLVALVELELDYLHSFPQEQYWGQG